MAAQRVARIDAADGHIHHHGAGKQALLLANHCRESKDRQGKGCDHGEDGSELHGAAFAGRRATPRVRRHPAVASARQSTPPPIKPKPVAVKPPIASK